MPNWTTTVNAFFFFPLYIKVVSYENKRKKKSTISLMFRLIFKLDCIVCAITMLIEKIISKFVLCQKKTKTENLILNIYTCQIF